MAKNQIVPLGRLEELKSEPKAASMTYRSLGGEGTMNFDAEVRAFPSRDALKAFLKKEASRPSYLAGGRGREWTALVKDLVRKNMVAYPSYQKESPDARLHESGGNPKITRGSGDWTVYYEVHRPLGEPEFHHYRFKSKETAETRAREFSLIDAGRYFTVHHRGLEVSEWYKGTTPREPGWLGGYRSGPRKMGPEPRASYLPSGSKHESGKNPSTASSPDTEITHEKYLPHLHETHYAVRYGAHKVKVVVDEKTGLFNITSLTRGKGWAGAASTAANIVRRKRHEQGKNPLTLSERAKIKLGVLSPAAARSANNREKDLLREHAAEVQKLIESVDACRRCDHSAEKKAKKHLAKAKEVLAGLEKLAKYRSDADIAEASMKPLRKRVFEAETRLLGKNPGAIVKHASTNGGPRKAARPASRAPSRGSYAEAEFHESESNPHVARKFPRVREITVFKAHSRSRAASAASKLGRAGLRASVVGRSKTVIAESGGSVSDAVLRAKIRALVGKK